MSLFSTLYGIYLCDERNFSTNKSDENNWDQTEFLITVIAGIIWLIGLLLYRNQHRNRHHS